jgi:aspartyl-tRNA(Asn)/glutamyl-tRNA(Gln) amidotransferase subunit B
MVEFAYRIGQSLDMKFAKVIKFDRKGYFYPDLANGYQITQFFDPIATEGKLTISYPDGKTKDIGITQIQMEEDTARQHNKDGQMLLDFNRAGVPLVEVVSKHTDMTSIEDVLLYVKQLREQLVILGVNDGNLHEGSFRVDVNVSISKDDNYGERVEIKNLNSFNNIKKALEFEIKQQEEILESGGKIEYVTKRYDEDLEETVLMRSKDTQTEYNFIPEGNINPIALTQSLKDEFNQFSVMKIDYLRQKTLKDVSEEQKETILSSRYLTTAFINLKKETDAKKVANFLTTNVVSAFKQSKISLDSKSTDSGTKLNLVLKLLIDGKATSSEANELLVCFANGKTITKKLEELSNKELASDNDVKDILIKIASDNPETMAEAKDRPERVEKFLMGQLMKETKGQVKPQDAMQLIKEILNEQV